MTPAARLAAAIDLLEVIDGAPRKPADAVANDFFRFRRFIGSGDRRAISDRVWAILRARRRLLWWLKGTKPTPRLMIAASLLLEGWTPEGVQQSFSGGKFAPAPLSRDENTALRPLAGHTLDHPEMPEAVLLEIPDWIFPRFQAALGPALATEMRAALLPAPMDLRANLLKTTREEAQAALAAEDVESIPTPHSPWGLRVATRRAITTGKAFTEGLVEIQDEGSQLIALLAGATPGMRVLDYCAGAAGKTLALAMTMKNRGHIVACDVSAPRLESAVRRLRRAGVHNVERHLLATGEKWSKRVARSFDRVLVDAPCTGTGTWRRNPDAKPRLTETDLTELMEKQARILDSAAQLVRDGGVLIYATCSLLREENEEQVTAFLARHPDFRQRALPPEWPTGPGDVLRLYPARHGTDGFFAATLERVKATA